ncbi:hypothetical protein [Streptomyces sp. NPDC001222]|uniref:hypothetical protein n=1 Tax=Streptomyces sp. NPDC001222 TaxID=3364548 RepID=UPI0036B822B1
MGLGITVMAVDWTRLEAVPAGERLDRLYGESDAAVVDAGWFWPTSRGEPWWGVHEFRDTLGSYKPHFWAGEVWDDVREHAVPELRDALDGFLVGLGIRWDPEEEDAPHDSESWRSELLLCRTPAEASALARLWARAEPLVDEVREPFDAHAARGPEKWMSDHAEFASLLRGWGEVVVEADRRGWGVVGLRC